MEEPGVGAAEAAEEKMRSREEGMVDEERRAESPVGERLRGGRAAGKMA